MAGMQTAICSVIFTVYLSAALVAGDVQQQYADLQDAEHIRVAAGFTTAANILKKDNYTGELIGFIPDYINALSKLEYFTYSIYTLPLLATGAKQPDGSWTGLMGELVTNKADVALAFFISSERERDVDFTVPFISQQVRILYNKKTGLDGVTYLVSNGTFFATVLENAKPYTPESAIWSNIVFKPYDESIELVKQGGYAVIGNMAGFKDLLGGDLVLDDRIISQSYVALAVQQGSPLRKRLSIATAGMIDDGSMQQLLDKWGIA